jgi:probable rRNA maturation factor
VRTALEPARLPRQVTVTLAFVSDAEMRDLNARYRDTGRVTDVLSFGPALPPGVRGAAAVEFLHAERSPDGSLELGDVVIAPEVARRQARRRGWSLAEEIAFLAAHGALHLLGYQDDTAAGYREMRRLGDDAVSRARQRMRRRSSTTRN